MSDNPNKIQRLQLENFTCFERADLEFSPGINVFIGENGTGKTHLLKAMYAYTLTSKRLNESKEKLNGWIWGPFFSDNLSKLIGVDSNKLIREVDEKQEGRFLLQIDTTKHSSFCEVKIPDLIVGNYLPNSEETEISNGLFIPVLEMLSWNEGFIPSFENRETKIDATYYYLAKALSLLPLKGDALEKSLELFFELERDIRIQVSRSNETFYVSFDKVAVEARASAQGINKLGQIIYLIKNGSLTKDTILFWDEPETGLNPKYIKVVAQFLQTLANAGVQIFVATHDYLLVHQLSLAAEYREVKQAPDMRFFSLYKSEQGTQIESADTVAGIEHNTILDEYAALHNEQLRLYSELLQKAE